MDFVYVGRSAMFPKIREKLKLRPGTQYFCLDFVSVDDARWRSQNEIFENFFGFCFRKWRSVNSQVLDFVSVICQYGLRMRLGELHNLWSFENGIFSITEIRKKSKKFENKRRTMGYFYRKWTEIEYSDQVKLKWHISDSIWEL